ncbi:MAG: Zn-dependent hydrolase, partial [Elusimicrobia bacterium]|nr:Zn-dependent hydrolase [Elusimicrobiota bacterium]
MAKTLSINGKRLYSSLTDLGKIGAYIDERTGIHGVNRLALTAADGAGRRLVVKWFRQAGLHVTIDRIGNVYGRRRGLEDHLPPVMLGS